MPFNENIPQLTPSTSNHADNFNAINNKLLENTQANKDGLSYANSRITGLDNTKLDKTTHTAYKSEQATKDSGQDAKISSLESGKVDKTAYATDKEAQGRKDIQQDTALTTETAERTTADEILQTNLDNKIVLNGEVGQSNFNFIENKVVQDGLVGIGNNCEINTSENFEIYYRVSKEEAGTGYLFNICNNTDFSLYYNGSVIQILYKTTNSFNKVNASNKGFVDGVNNITILKVDDIVRITLNGSLCEIRLIDFVGVTAKPILNYGQFLFTYNRQLTQQEIQHNLSVLNNSPSVNQLEVTNEANETSILSLGSTGNHVEMATGRTLEEEYMGVLEGMSQEYTSTGGAITVNDGLKARLVGAEITGQTVNCLYSFDGQYTTGTKACAFTQQTKTGSQYTVVVNVAKNTSSNVITINGNKEFLDAYISIPAGYTGLFTKTINATKTNDKCSVYISDPIGTIEINHISFVEGSFEGKIGKCTTGLNSTVATISNNGIKYPFYQQYIEGETVVQKRAKGSSNEWVTIPRDETRDTVANEYRLYSASGLGSVPSVTDKVDLASGVKTDNTKEVVLNGSEAIFTTGSVLDKTIAFKIPTSPQCSTNTAGDKAVVSNLFFTKSIYSIDEEGIMTNTTNGDVIIRILKTRLSAIGLNGFKEWLTQNPVTVRYQLATPIQTQLTDEEFATYSPYKKQISLGGVGGVSDKLTLNSDGSLSVLGSTKEVVLNGSENISINTTGISFTSFLYDNALIKIGSNAICDKIQEDLPTVALGATKECFGVSGSSNRIIISIANSKLNTIDVNGFKLWLQSNPLTFRIQLATPTTTTIPKEVNAPVLTNQSNILSGGEAVAPSSFKVKVPVDVMAKINRLEALHI